MAQSMKALAARTAKIRDDLIDVVTECNEQGNFGTAEIAQTAVRNIASLADRCAAEAKGDKEPSS